MSVSVRAVGEHEGREVHEYTLQNDAMVVKVVTYGATVTSVKVREQGVLQETSLNHAELEGVKTSPYYGATCGRVANRIANGKFVLDGTAYQLAINNGPNSLHGGQRNFSRVVWEAEVVGDGKSAPPAVAFTYLSPHMDEGYPGNLKAQVTMSLEGSGLCLSYSAETDQPTPVNLTNHTYWNLTGGAESIRTHHLHVHCGHYTPVDDNLIPTGQIADVAGTPFDLRAPVLLGERLDAVPGGGFDHNFVVAADAKSGELGALREVAQLVHQPTKRVLTVFTTEPGLQVYTYNFGSTSPENHPHVKHNAVCFEAQNFPNAINTPSFPSCVLRPGASYHQRTEYRFSSL